MDKKLRNKVAVVTGAGQGIGRGIAEVFAEEGADVVINDKTLCPQAEEVAEWVRAQGRRSLAIGADVSKRPEVEAMFERAWKEIGPIDVLVNNAGIETIVPFLDLTDEQWSDVVNINLRGEWLCSQIFCQRLVEAGRQGSVINIGSIQAGKVLPGRSHYAPAKLAIEALTRNTSAEMGPLGIRVNCIHPGLIQTTMTDWVMKKPDLLANVVSQISLGRPGQPCEIGTVAAFLASDEAKYVTGQCIYVDGGWFGK
ncbi:MAG TPA: 3-oxoacyl-ACP reductase family protein [Acidobacteriaceae bacterium]|jgi:glucose 1-dehydrogenase/3-oxoacyl-[acyl-carrier protein] reductase